MPHFFAGFCYTKTQKFLLLNGGILCDVSGKGIPAALFMMTAKTLIRSIALRDPSPEKILYRTNAAIEEFNEHNMFVTVWLGILEISSGKLTFADAGHERMALFQGGEWKHNRNYNSKLQRLSLMAFARHIKTPPNHFL